MVEKRTKPYIIDQNTTNLKISLKIVLLSFTIVLICIMRGNKPRIHSNRIDDKARGIICHNYALKGVQLKYRGLTNLDLSIVFSLYNQTWVYVSAIQRMIMRSKQAIYGILQRVCIHGIIEKHEIKQQYRLTLKGIEVYDCYLRQHKEMGDNLDRLEEVRISRMK